MTILVTVVHVTAGCGTDQAPSASTSSVASSGVSHVGRDPVQPNPGQSGPSQSSSTQSNPGQPTTTSADPGPAGPGPASVVLALDDTHQAGFVTPSGNIGCLFTATQVTCGARQADWDPPPPRDPGCDLDVVSVLTLRDGTAGWQSECRGDPPGWMFGGDQWNDDWFDPARHQRISVDGMSLAALGYGQSMQQGSMVCEVAETGVTCRDQVSGHGFSIARAAHSVF